MENLWPGFIGFLSVDGKPICGENVPSQALQAQAKTLIESGVDPQRINVNDRWATTVGEVDADGRIVPYTFESVTEES